MELDNIYIGNSFDLLKEVEDNSFDMILTDPPYDFTEDQKIYLHNQFNRICSGVIIVFSPPENQWILPADQYLFWVKPISTKNTSKSYSRFVEMLFVYNRTTWNSNRHWSQYTNVFTDLVESKDHPYKKPKSMIKRLILNHSNPNSRILDPFCGSGTVPKLCQDLGRKYLGIEIDKSRITEFFEVKIA